MRAVDLNQCLVSSSCGELGGEGRRIFIVTLVRSAVLVSKKNSNFCLCLLWKNKQLFVS